MAMKKIAISLPGAVLERVDKLAASRGESRSHLIATVLDRVSRVKHDHDITAQIDALLPTRKSLRNKKPQPKRFYGCHHGALRLALINAFHRAPDL